MKKIVIILGILFFGSTGVFASENTTIIPEQGIENDQTYFTTDIQKQPQEKGSKQGIKNHFTFFTVNINVNGKVLNYTLPDGQK